MSSSDESLPGKVIWARRGFWARFTPEIERAFRRHYEDDLVQRARWSAVIAAAVMAVYSLLDVFMVEPDILPQFLWVRWLFMILPLLCVSSLSYTTWGARHLQKIAAVASVSSALAVVAMIVIARRNGTPIEYEGIILTTFYFYCCGGLRIRWSLLAGSVAAVSYPVAEYFAGLSAHDLAVRSLFLVSTNVVGLISAALMELAARRGFAQLIALETMSNSDPLTGLLNRRALDRRLPALWENARRNGENVQIAMIDVDYFKQYNDHYGHAGGDDVLRELGALLSDKSHNPQDLAARFGGEEFLCIWSTPPDQSAEARLEEILREVRELARLHEKSPLGRLSVSIGAIELRPDPLLAPDAAGALREADALLYRAKSQGRNQAVLSRARAPQARAEKGVFQTLSLGGN
ncbi:GGDEF domain-containing protein [Falsigemmobacter faecalis]|uniref:diguanylate cyclase n=1 Tax=Falsigemmobacter faecalis TaxID=2488730 RepID=A0A3P3D863_9RHOB|nr:GGDEF domain-containing protein [Falsigemmobacter faecalis]RRH69766.1 GGDEF domain-containing protein [Falsigemmobacter faecalis]